jgi:hypothetical protein
MYQEAGNCTNCGAPYYVAFTWHGILPPPPIHSCNCWNNSVTQTTFGSFIVTDSYASES